MDASHLSHLLRRSRLRSFAAGTAHIDLGARSPNETSDLVARIPMEKRAPQDDSNNPHVNHGQAVGATRTVGQAVGAPSRQAAQAATIGTTRTTSTAVRTATREPAAASSAKQTLQAASSSAKKTIDFGTPSTSSSSSATPETSATPSSTSTTPSSSAAPSSTYTSTSTVQSTTTSTTRTSATTSTTPSSTVQVTTSSTTARALTVTSTTSASPTSTLDAAKAGTSSSGMSTGAIVGVALGAIVGLVVLGSFIGWVYRKWASRSYKSQLAAPWSKIDDDITPYPHPTEKFSDNDDIYGGSVAPVIGSRRALAMARDNAYNHDSDMYDRGDNRAGVGAGGLDPYSPYPQYSPPTGAYGLDPQGRPYNGQAGRTPMDHMYENQFTPEPYYDMPQDSARQLIGPGPGPNGHAHPYAPAVPMPTPVPMGRPAAPSTAAEFALCEDFADEPEPLAPGLAYTLDEPRTPTASESRTAGRSRVSMSTPQASQGNRVLSPTESVQMHDYIPAPPLAVPPPVASASSSTLAPIPLPNFAPLSPLMSDFEFKRRSQPLPMYEDERTTQKRLYGEVATTAGISEPVTPNTAQPIPSPVSRPVETLDLSTSTTSSFSAPQADLSTSRSSTMPRLPELTLAPPEPYQHGQPLSPLNEVPTPMSTGEPMLNPFDLPLPGRHGHGGALAPPFSASTTGATGMPSPAYPPPSPGGMSVPGSVTESPRRWDSDVGTPKGRAVSVNYDEEDAYGGI